MTTKSVRPDDRAVILSRIGQTAQERLVWVVDRVQQNTTEMTTGDRENLRLELAAFIELGNPLPRILVERWHAHGFRPRNSKRIQRSIDESEVPGILDRLKCNLGYVVRREGHYPVGKGRVGGIGGYWRVWNEPLQRWEGYFLQDLSQADYAALALDRLVAECGHLVKACPAPAIRAKASETCGRWFVAKRPNQDYCSATCQSRASTRAARSGMETAAALLHRVRQAELRTLRPPAPKRKASVAKRRSRRSG